MLRITKDDIQKMIGRPIKFIPRGEWAPLPLLIVDGNDDETIRVSSICASGLDIIVDFYAYRHIQSTALETNFADELTF